jgi:hypothetical protein
VEEFERFVRGAAFLILHALLAAIAIVCMWGIDELIKWLWHNSDPRVLDLVPLRYIFEGIDALIVGALGVRGVIAAFNVFRE